MRAEEGIAVGCDVDISMDTFTISTRPNAYVSSLLIHRVDDLQPQNLSEWTVERVIVARSGPQSKSIFADNTVGAGSYPGIAEEVRDVDVRALRAGAAFA